jgi:flagellar biosynthesis protein
MVLMSAFERLLEQKAVALQYSPEKDTAPVIVASGMGYMAEKITEAARKSGVPVYEDDSLATLLSRLQLGAAVPEELYQAIIEIYIYFLGYVPSPEEKENEEKQKEEISKLEKQMEEEIKKVINSVTPDVEIAVYYL